MKRKKYTDVANVEEGRKFLGSEEYPEGAYGSPFGEGKKVENKSSPWLPGQQYISGYTYENRRQHAHLRRNYPGSHPTHADSNDD